MPKCAAEILFMEVLEEKAQAGDIEVLVRNEDGDISCFTYTEQGEQKLHKHLEKEAALGIMEWLRPENLN